MDINKAIETVNNSNKDVARKTILLFESHGFNDKSQDITLLFSQFIEDPDKFTDKQHMPKIWGSDSSYAQGFDALKHFIEFNQVKQHLITSMGEESYATLNDKLYDLKKKYQRLARNKPKVECTIPTEPAKDLALDSSDTSQQSSSEEEDDAITWTPEHINALIIQNDCALKFIWDLANSEQDPFKKTILLNLHRSIKAIGPMFKPT